LDYREESNDQFNFADFVLSCIAQNYFVAGDFLIVDNAAVHHGSETFQIIQYALEIVGAKLPGMLPLVDCYLSEVNYFNNF
jgi:hypothetical protein